MPVADETFYAVRRADGEPMGEYSFFIVANERDWAPAYDYHDPVEPTTYEMLRLDVTVLESLVFPRCQEECGKPAKFWGLCEAHAREDDPEHFNQPDEESP